VVRRSLNARKSALRQFFSEEKGVVKKRLSEGDVGIENMARELKKLESITSRKKLVRALGREYRIRKENLSEQIVFDHFLRKIVVSPWKEQHIDLTSTEFAVAATGDLYATDFDKHGQKIPSSRWIVEKGFAARVFEEKLNAVAERKYAKGKKWYTSIKKKSNLRKIKDKTKGFFKS